MDRTTGDLTARIASGDPEAFARFYETWFDRVLAEARRTTGRDESFCLDVVHDVMLRVVKSLRPLDAEAALAVWLRRTTWSCACDRLRRDARRRRREETVAAGVAGPAPADRGHDDRDRIAWLERELATLDEPTRALLDMRHRFGWSLARIGATLGLRPGAVDGRIRRAIDTLGRRAREVLDD